MFECFDFLECALAFTVLFYTYLPSALCAATFISAHRLVTRHAPPARTSPHPHNVCSNQYDYGFVRPMARPLSPISSRLFHLPPPPSCASAFAAHHLPASIPAIIAPDRTFACSSPSGFEKRVGFAVSGCFLCSALVCWLCFWSVLVNALCCRRWLADWVYGIGFGAWLE